MKTVSSILKSERERNGWEIEEVSRFLKIHPKYLKALEEGRYDVFSDIVHIKGFLKNYASFLGLNVSEVMAFFRREYGEDPSGDGISIPSDSLLMPKFIVTPSVVAAISIVVLVLSFLGYLMYQYRSFASAPKLEINNPDKDMVITEDVINIYGTTEKDSELFINGQKVEVAEDGGFATTISLSSGVNNLSFLSVNKLGKETRVNRTVVVDLKKADRVVGSGAGITDVQESTGSARIGTFIIMDVTVGPNASWIRIEADNEIQFDGVMLAGAERRFKGSKYIKIKVGNAGSVRVAVDGKDLGVAGKEGEVWEREFRVKESY